MGTPMFKNIFNAGIAVRGYNRSPEKAQQARESGAQILTDLSAVVTDADVIITMLSDDAAVSEVTEKMLPFLKKGALHISMSTIAATTSSKLAELHEAAGTWYIAAPVMGRPPAAAAKQLFILTSGRATAKEKAEPILKELGQRVFDFGEDAGAANTVKLSVNYMIFTIVELLSEVMLVAEGAGLDKNVLLETITSTIFGAPVFKIYGPMVVEQKIIENGFATALASKDLRLMQETAALQKITLPLAGAIQENLTSIIKSGKGNIDVSYLATHLKERLTR